MSTLSMINVLAARIFFALASGLVLSSCVFTSRPTITAAPESAELRNRFITQMHDLELATGKRYKGRAVHINAPVPAIYRDWRKMPVAKIRGRRQGGLTSWRAATGQTTVSLAAWRGYTPEWLIRHEALHTVLLSHGITGHPSRYASLFGKSYWWMPEAYYRNKAKSERESEQKKSDRPLLRAVFNRKGEHHSDEVLAACPLCGISVEDLAAGREFPTGLPDE